MTAGRMTLAAVVLLSACGRDRNLCDVTLECLSPDATSEDLDACLELEEVNLSEAEYAGCRDTYTAYTNCVVNNSECVEDDAGERSVVASGCDSLLARVQQCLDDYDRGGFDFGDDTLLLDHLIEVEAIRSADGFGPWQQPVLLLGSTELLGVLDAATLETLGSFEPSALPHTVEVLNDLPEDGDRNDTVGYIVVGGQGTLRSVFSDGSFGATVANGQRWGDIWAYVSGTAGFIMEAVQCAVGPIETGTWDYGTYYAAPETFMSLPGAEGTCISTSGGVGSSALGLTTEGQLYLGDPARDSEAVLLTTLDALFGVDLSDTVRVRCTESEPALCGVAHGAGVALLRWGSDGDIEPVEVLPTESVVYDLDLYNSDGGLLVAFGSGTTAHVERRSAADFSSLESVTHDLSSFGCAELRAVSIEPYTSGQSAVWTCGDETDQDGKVIRTPTGPAAE